MIDTHAHLTSAEFDDVDDIINSFEDNNIDCVLTIGTDYESSVAAISLAMTHHRVYASIGVHPHYCNKDTDLSWIRSLATSSMVKAIGEIGLDYHYQGYDKQAQHDKFVQQIHLSYELQLPYIVHMRDATSDTLSVVKANPPRFGAIMHCFCGSEGDAIDFLELGFCLSFSGNITYKSAQDIRQAVKIVPMDRVLIETDCPYLAPLPYRGKRNQPKYVSYVAQQIASIKELPLQYVLDCTTDNARRLLRL